MRKILIISFMLSINLSLPVFAEYREAYSRTIRTLAVQQYGYSIIAYVEGFTCNSRQAIAVTGQSDVATNNILTILNTAVVNGKNVHLYYDDANHGYDGHCLLTGVGISR